MPENNHTGHLSFGTFFLRLIVSNAAACLVICLIYIILFSQSLYEVNKSEILQADRSQLSTIVTNLDYQLNILAQSQTQVSYSGNVLGQIYSKSLQTSYVSNINMELIHLSDYTSLVQEAFLYIPSFDAVISSEKTGGTSASAETYRYGDIIACYESHEAETVEISGTARICRLFCRDGYLVMVCDFPLDGEKKLASLFYIIDREEIAEILSAQLPEGTSLLIGSGEGADAAVVACTGGTFSENTQDMQDAEDALLSALKVSREDFSGEEAVYRGDAILFLETSEITGWSYYYAVDAAQMVLTPVNILTRLLPGLMIMLVLSACVSYVLSRYAYRPVQKLLDGIREQAQTRIPGRAGTGTGTDRAKSETEEEKRAETAKERISGKEGNNRKDGSDGKDTNDGKDRSDGKERTRNEVTYVLDEYRRVSERTEELNALLTDLSHDTHSRIFHNLLAETSDSDRIPHLLELIDSDFHENDLYFVSLIRVADRKGEDTENRKIRLLRDITELCQETGRNWSANTHSLMMNGLSFVVIFAFRPDSRAQAVYLARNEFETEVRRRIEGAEVASGHLYSSVYEICYSYRDAVKRLDDRELPDEHRREENPEHGDITTQEEGAVQEVSLTADFDTYAEYIVRALQQNNRREAQDLAESVLLQIRRSGRKAEELPEQYQRFLDRLLDRILCLEYMDQLSVKSGEMAALAAVRDEAGGMDEDRLYAETERRCRYLLDETYKVLRKQKNHYIVAAQEYIAKHYQDYDLSQTVVSEELGIDASYLSRLFRSNLGIRFTEYLNKYRIQMGRELLTGTDDTVQQISERTGFNSVQNFIRVFKKYTGVSPGQYRNMHTGDKLQ